MKYVIFLGDGMADVPGPELGGKTRRAGARHPGMDRMAQYGAFGMVRTVPEGMSPGSDTANLSVFGYDPRVYYSGRSPLEAASIGIELDAADVTYRCNLVTLSDAPALEAADMVDYSAGEISSAEARELVEAVNARFGSDAVRLYPGVSYRQCLVLRRAETGARLTPPHDISGRSVRGRLPEGQNASLLREMMEFSYRTFAEHPVNAARMRAGKRPANAVWFWGEGRKPALKPFAQMRGVRGGVISAVDLIQGIGKCAGMRVIHVEGATGNYHTNFSGKGQAAIEALRTGCDLVYIHVEAPDECGHQGQVREKVYAIEQIDAQIVQPVLAYLDAAGEDYAALLLPDHPTPLCLRTHTGDPVPFALYRRGDGAARDARFTESAAQATGLFEPEGFRLMDRLLGARQD